MKINESMPKGMHSPLNSPKSDVDELLSSYKMTKAGLDKILNYIKEYKNCLRSADSQTIDGLIIDIQREKSTSYQSLRKWKMDSIMNRYTDIQSKIEEYEDIKDYFLEMEDDGFLVDIDMNSSKVKFTCKDHPIAHLNKLFHFLTNNRRFGFKLIYVNGEPRLRGGNVQVLVEFNLRKSVNTEIHFDTEVD